MSDDAAAHGGVCASMVRANMSQQSAKFPARSILKSFHPSVLPLLLAPLTWHAW
ncbi:MAG: hypothetical protein ACJAWZ_004121, partial [Paracoccaceae bacterium]